MTEVELVRSREDRRRFDLEGYGSLRRTSWLSRDSELRTADGAVLTARPVGFLQRRAEVVDAVGTVVGEFRTRAVLTHGGDLTWAGEQHGVSSESFLTTRYLVSRGERSVVTVQVKGWGGRRPAVVTVADPSVAPGLVLFAVWLVQGFAASDASSASAGAT